MWNFLATRRRYRLFRSGQSTSCFVLVGPKLTSTWLTGLPLRLRILVQNIYEVPTFVWYPWLAFQGERADTAALRCKPME